MVFMARAVGYVKVAGCSCFDLRMQVKRGLVKAGEMGCN
jgi:hypothetical protein